MKTLIVELVIISVYFMIKNPEKAWISITIQIIAIN